LNYDGTSAVDGGVGYDTLLISNDIDLDFSDTNLESISNIEKIDLTSGDHTLTNLSLDDVLDMTDANNTLEITGDDADELLNVDTTGWTQESVVDDGTSTTYTYSNDTTSDSITLIVDDNIQNSGL
jgi:hypothetical protein